MSLLNTDNQKDSLTDQLNVLIDTEQNPVVLAGLYATLTQLAEKCRTKTSEIAALLAPFLNTPAEPKPTTEPSKKYVSTKRSELDTEAKDVE